MKKPNKPMGRPKVWAPELGLSECHNTSAPVKFWEAWKDWNFRKQLSQFTLDFLASNGK